MVCLKTTFFTIVDILYCNWCIIKVLLSGKLSEMWCYSNHNRVRQQLLKKKNCEKCWFPSITWYKKHTLSERERDLIRYWPHWSKFWERWCLCLVAPTVGAGFGSPLPLLLGVPSLFAHYTKCWFIYREKLIKLLG